MLMYERTSKDRKRERKSNTTTTIEAHEDKLSKATSFSLPNKMIAKPEWAQSNTQQNTEQLQNPTTGATHFSLFVATNIKHGRTCATLIVYRVIYNIYKSSLRKNLHAVKSNF